MFLKISQISQENTFTKKRLQHRCFPVKFETFLRTPILKKICERELFQITKITRSRPQSIFSLPRKFQENNKNTDNKIQNPLTELGIRPGKEVLFLDLYVIQNVFKTWEVFFCFFVFYCVLYYIIIVGIKSSIGFWNKN